jgi:peroxiredoxin
MSLVLLLIRLLLAVVFAVAGLAKLADRAGSRQALVDFGVPALLAPPFGVLLPLAELAVAVALLPVATAWWGALGALALLLLFVVGIAANLARGRTPDCHCFGQLHSAPAGWSTLIRNLILAALAGLVVGLGPQYPAPNVLGWFGALALAQRIELLVGVVVVALLAVESWVLLKVLSQQGRLLLRLEAMEARLTENGLPPLPAPTESAASPVTGLPVGTPAPAFALSTLTGERVTLEALRALGKPVVLIFSDPGCGPCTALLPEIGHWQREHATTLVVALMSRGTVEANRPKVTEYGLTHVLLQQDREVAEAYQAYGTPSAVLVRRDGTIGSPLAAGADAIRALITSALNLPVPSALPTAASADGNGRGAAPAPGQPAGPQVGETAPEFMLPDLTGKQVGLADFRGSRTLVLFWNPGCGFCQQMLADLKAWEARPPEGAPRLLVVSTGTVEANALMGLRSPVLLDQGFSAGSKFGANGTPMAVLVDAEGKIASELAAGAPAVLALARSGMEPVSQQ